MKLIFSRKGFDSGYGGCASPIFNDRSMVSLPIPLPGAPHTLAEATAHHEDFNSRDVLQDLTRRKAPANRLTRDLTVHLDPYLRRYSATTSAAEWRPGFGQDGGAQGHLREQKVKKGDLFLFFGWFRSVQLHSGCWRYVPKSPDLHVLFGWLQIDEVFSIDSNTHDCRPPKPWLADHPHWRCRSDMEQQNTIYVASERLKVAEVDMDVPGGGVFDCFEPRLQLTDPDVSRRSLWRLPGWFHPEAREGLRLSHHNAIERWRWADGSHSHAQLQTVAIGQEFVMDLGAAPSTPAQEWLRALLSAPPS